MRYRSQARELALKALCFLDVTRDDKEEMFSLFCSNFKETSDPAVGPFFFELVQGVNRCSNEIDTWIINASKNWRLSRMPVVDRNILRLAVFELVRLPDIPASVSINEAVDLGKKFGSRHTGPFVNGVLDRIRITENIE